MNYKPFSDEEIAELRRSKQDMFKRSPDLDRRLGWAGDLPGLMRRTLDELEVIASRNHLHPY